jgi:hypothetical protein
MMTAVVIRENQQQHLSPSLLSNMSVSLSASSVACNAMIRIDAMIRMMLKYEEMDAAAAHLEGAHIVVGCTLEHLEAQSTPQVAKSAKRTETQTTRQRRRQRGSGKRMIRKTIML